jgi:hypothetical protein
LEAGRFSRIGNIENIFVLMGDFAPNFQLMMFHHSDVVPPRGLGQPDRLIPNGVDGNLVFFLI